MLDPRLVLTFALVAETRSFTRAAERLGVAQPWVSEQLRRLESQLGFKVLTRTSRAVELTDEGREFLPFANAIAAANEAAQNYAREAITGLRRTLRLGAVDLVTGFPERTLLIDGFVEAFPLARLHIESGTAVGLQNRLLSGDLDVFIGFKSSFDLGAAFPGVPLCHRVAHVMIPQEDPLAGSDTLDIGMLRGRTVVSAPGRTDPAALRVALRPLVEAGVTVTPAPEANRTTIEHMARIRRQMCLRWSEQQQPRRAMGDMVCLPLIGDPLRLDVRLFARGDGRRQITRDFFATANRLVEANGWTSN